MFKRLYALLKATPRRLLSVLKPTSIYAWSVLKATPARITSATRSLAQCFYFCLKATAVLLLCGILLMKVLESLPGPRISSIQVDKNLPPLAAAKVYDYKRSIVRLYRGDQFYCSGVVIGSNYVLTASHCLVDEDGIMNRDPVTVVNDDGSQVVMSRPVGVNLRMDWGLLHGNFSNIPGALVTEVGFDPPSVVTACGYPQGSKALNCSELQPWINDAFLVKCKPGGMLFPGMSGGPVFDGEGHVIGLNVLVYPAQQYGGTAYSPTTGILANFGIAD